MKLKVFSSPKDLFADIPDAFEDIELPVEEKVIFSPEFQKLVAAEVAKAVAAIKLPEPKEPKPQIVKEVRVEVPKKDTRDLVEKSAVEKLEKKIAELEKQLESTDRAARTPVVVSHGGAGVIGIPPPEAATVNYVLTVDANKKAAWKESQGGGSGGSLEGFTVINGGSTLTFDAQNVSIDELASVVANIISQLQD